ncbi:MAG: thymidine phosphorylase, partial [Proteobacteria bacterium]|nr:thymidine phosphorylase [Pseudomonadota bacterium]
MNSHEYSRTGTLPPRFRELMQGCREMVRSHLIPLFQRMLENGDIALLEFAGKAESNVMQSKFFEAMQEFKRKHADLELAFHKSVDAGFRDFIDGNVGAGMAAENAGGTTMPKLSLVDKLEVEAALPVQNMVAKANANYSEHLYGLNQRLAVINGGSRLPEAARPGWPVLLAEAVRGAFNLLDMDNKTRMVVYAVFDRFVMREIGGMYDEYNRRLVNAGILPHLKYEIRKQHDSRRATPAARPAPGTSGAVPPKAAGTAVAQTVGEEAFQSILELMARGRGGSGSYAPGT